MLVCNRQRSVRLIVLCAVVAVGASVNVARGQKGEKGHQLPEDVREWYQQMEREGRILRFGGNYRGVWSAASSARKFRSHEEKWLLPPRAVGMKALESVKALFRRKIDVSVLEQEEMARMWDGLEDRVVSKISRGRLGTSALVFVVNEKNRVRALTAARAQDLILGRIGKWNEVGWVGRPVRRVAQGLDLTLWGLEPVYRGAPSEREDVRAAQHGIEWKKTRGGVLHEVANDVNAVGWLALDPDVRLPEGVRIVPISRDEESDAIQATRENILLGDYPVCRTLWLLWLREARPLTKEFVEYARSESGSEALENHGFYFGMSERGELLAERNLAARRRGEGVTIRATGYRDLAGLVKALGTAMTESRGPVRIAYDPFRSVSGFVAGDESLFVSIGPKGERIGKELAENSSASRPIAARVVAVIVNAKNPMRTATVRQIRQVYEGGIGSWSRLGGEEADIRVVGLVGNDPSTRLFSEVIFDGGRKKGFAAMEDASDVIRAVLMDEHAIGFVNLASVADDQIAKVFGKSGVRMLRIGSGDRAVGPEARHVVNGRYPIAEVVTVFLQKDADAQARDLFKFVGTPEAGKALREQGWLQVSVR